MRAKAHSSFFWGGFGFNLKRNNNYNILKTQTRFAPHLLRELEGEAILHSFLCIFVNFYATLPFAMKSLILALALVPALSNSSLAKQAPYHGNFIICTNEENTVKMTADLSDGKDEQRVATSVVKDIKKVFPEANRKKGLHRFQFYPTKKTPLIVTPKGAREAEIRLVLDPEQKEYEVLYDTREPMVYKMTRFQGLLTLKSSGIKDRPVTCTESRWETD